MLHPQVRRLDQLVAVFIPGIRAEPGLEALQHRLHLLELLARCVDVVVERIEIEREFPLLSLISVAEVRVVSGIDRHVVIVDRVGDEPLVSDASGGVGRCATEPAVRHVHQGIGDRDRDALAVGLVGKEILIRPPDAGAEAFIGGDDPFAAETIESPDESAVPRRTHGDGRLAVIVDGNGFVGARLLRRDHRDEEGIPIAARAQLGSVLHDAVDDERHLQIDLHLARGLEHPIGDCVIAGDTAVGWIDFDVEVVEGGVPPGARGRIGASYRVGVREDRRGGVLCAHGNRQSGQEQLQNKTTCRPLRPPLPAGSLLLKFNHLATPPI